MFFSAASIFASLIWPLSANPPPAYLTARIRWREDGTVPQRVLINVDPLPLSRPDLTKIEPSSWILVTPMYIGIRRGAGRSLWLTELRRHRTTWCDYLWPAWLKALVAVLVAEDEHIKPVCSRLLHRSRLAQETERKDLNKYGWATLTAKGKTGCPLEPICRTNEYVVTAARTCACEAGIDLS